MAEALSAKLDDPGFLCCVEEVPEEGTYVRVSHPVLSVTSKCEALFVGGGNLRVMAKRRRTHRSVSPPWKSRGQKSLEKPRALAAGFRHHIPASLANEPGRSVRNMDNCA